MNNQQQVSMSVDPNHYYVSGVNIIFGEEEFLLQLNSGFQVRRFLVSPKHAKRIFLLLQQQIAEYEKKFGELKTELPSAKGETSDNKKQIGFQP